MDTIIKNEDRETKIFYIILALVVAISVGYTFYKIIIQNNYQIVSQVSCDPTFEKCFVTECDPATDTTCPQNPAERATYYKKINKNASTISKCIPTIEKIGCGKELSCTVGESNCSYIFCNPADLKDGEACF